MNLMSSQDYCESLKEYSPTVYVRGSKVESVVDEPQLTPGINALGLSYDFARLTQHREYALATQHTSGKTVNRFVHINRDTEDLLSKLEYVRGAVSTDRLRNAISDDGWIECSLPGNLSNRLCAWHRVHFSPD